MEFSIRQMKEKDRECVLSMMEEFYNSDAVLTNGSREIFENDFNNCINGCPYLEGYIFENGGIILGYGMIAKSFSTEFGKICIWFEDLYLKPEFRGNGIFKHLFGKVVEEARKRNCIVIKTYEKNNRERLHKLGFEDSYDYDEEGIYGLSDEMEKFLV